jgi:hypothetical protein
MMNKQPLLRPAHDYLINSENQPLKALLAKLREQEQLTQQILPYLTPAQRTYCQMTILKNHCLIIITTNASTATEIHFCIPDLLSQFRQQPSLHQIHDIHCKVRPLSSAADTSSHRTHRVKQLSPQTAASIYDIAQSLSDTKLRKAMERIAQHTTTISPKIR